MVPQARMQSLSCLYCLPFLFGRRKNCSQRGCSHSRSQFPSLIFFLFSFCSTSFPHSLFVTCSCVSVPDRFPNKFPSFFWYLSSLSHSCLLVFALFLFLYLSLFSFPFFIIFNPECTTVDSVTHCQRMSILPRPSSMNIP